ncbi:hypothetical protein BD779DRAFT_167389 [Infundibulicybe gibba]|nr:hypothetical protein BD779DRAFT_167389 [Infundibulicybe gibba]
MRKNCSMNSDLPVIHIDIREDRDETPRPFTLALVSHSMSVTQVPDNLGQIITDARITNYVAVASLTLLAFDHILTFGEEIELIWKSRWNLSKTVYLLQRYFALISLSGLTAARLRGSCGQFYRVEGVAITVIICVVDFVLVVRVWTLYARNWRVFMFLSTLTTLEIIAMMAVDETTITAGMKGDYVLTASTTMLCNTPNTPLHIISFYPLAPLIVTSIMFTMTLWKCASTLYEYRNNHMPILSLFLRDGVFWFLAVFVVTLITFVNWRYGRVSLVTVMNSPMAAVYTLVSSRTLLNLREIVVVQPAQLSQMELGSRMICATNPATTPNR